MASAVPGTVQYLVELFQGVNDQLFVWFGKELAVFKAPLTLQIYGIDGNQDWAEMGPNFRREETFAVMCQLSSYAGDQSTTASINRMVEVFDAFDPIIVAIATDYTLGGNVRLSEVKNFEFIPDADVKGQSIGHLQFEVYCQVRITTLTEGPNEP